jgi:hypothetical protein
MGRRPGEDLEHRGAGPEKPSKANLALSDRFENSARRPKPKFELGPWRTWRNYLLRRGKFEWVPNGRGGQPQRKPAFGEGFRVGANRRGEQPPAKNGGIPWLFSADRWQRECRPKACWRRDRNPGQTLSFLYFKDLE